MCPADSFDDIRAAGWWIRNMYHEVMHFGPNEEGPQKNDTEWDMLITVVHLQNYMSGKDPDAGWRQGKPVPGLIEKAKEETKKLRILSAWAPALCDALNDLREQIGIPELSTDEIEMKKPVDEHGK